LKERQIKNIRITPSAHAGEENVQERINAFYVRFIERRLNACDLTAQERIQVVDGIIKNLKTKEERGPIP